MMRCFTSLLFHVGAAPLPSKAYFLLRLGFQSHENQNCWIFLIHKNDAKHVWSPNCKIIKYYFVFHQFNEYRIFGAPKKKFKRRESDVLSTFLCSLCGKNEQSQKTSRFWVLQEEKLFLHFIDWTKAVAKNIKIQKIRIFIVHWQKHWSKETFRLFFWTNYAWKEWYPEIDFHYRDLSQNLKKHA